MAHGQRVAAVGRFDCADGGVRHQTVLGDVPRLRALARAAHGLREDVYGQRDLAAVRAGHGRDGQEIAGGEVGRFDGRVDDEGVIGCHLNRDGLAGGRVDCDGITLDRRDRAADMGRRLGRRGDGQGKGKCGEGWR